MSKIKEEWFVPEKCLNCTNDCKLELNIILKAKGENEIYCKKFNKIKDK